MKLINAEELEDLLYKQIEQGATDFFDAFEDALQDTPTIDPVHAAGACYCKECEYVGIYEATGNLYCKHQNGISSPKPDDFCSYGRRKENTK